MAEIGQTLQEFIIPSWLNSLAKLAKFTLFFKSEIFNFAIAFEFDQYLGEGLGGGGELLGLLRNCKFGDISPKPFYSEVWN